MATQAKVIIKGENNLTKAVKSASSDLSGLKGAADKLGSTIKGAFTVTAIIAGVKALGNAVKDCVSSWTVQEQAYVSLDAVMGNIGKSTGMELPAGNWFDGTEVYSDSEHTEAEADSFREPALIQACNAESESRVVGSGTIIAVSNVETVMTATNPNVTGKVESAGGSYLKVEAHNPGNIAFNLTRLDAYGDVIYEKDTSIVRTANVAQETEQSDSLLKEELSYVHDRLDRQPGVQDFQKRRDGEHRTM